MSGFRKRLILLGAGDLAREVLWVATRVPADARDWHPGGILATEGGADDGLHALGLELPRLGAPADFVPDEHDVFICAVGAPRTKLELAAPLRARGAPFVNVIDPSAAVAPDATLGTGVFLSRQVTVSVGARVGDDVSVNMYASIGHDVVLGDGCTVSSHCDLTGRAVAGRGVMFGSHAVVLPEGRVGDFAVVGAGTVVLRSVRAETSVFGVPARAL